MRNRSGFRSLKTPRKLCKLSGGRRCGLPGRAMLALLVVGLAAGCQAPHSSRTVTEQQLESQPPKEVSDALRVPVADPGALRSLCVALGPRLGLVQVKSAADFVRLRRAAPAIGACPDLNRGTLVGLVCWDGTSLSAPVTLELDSIRVCNGGGLLEARYAGGSHLPDGSAELVMTYVPRMANVLVVSINGSRFYP